MRLDDRYLVGDRTNDRLHLLPIFDGGRPNPAAARLDARRCAAATAAPPSTGAGSGAASCTRRRVEIVDLLDERDAAGDLLHLQPQPVRRGGAACLAAGVRLTNDDERGASARSSTLGSAGWPRRPRRARLRPVRRPARGRDRRPPRRDGAAIQGGGRGCFVEGLVKVVFATETLAVGINMPARTVVIEKLTKFTGDHHEILTPGEYTQLTGRAGRRGIDEAGQAVVLWSPFVPFEQVAALAASRTFHLRSAFRPTYNMVANLVRTYTASRPTSCSSCRSPSTRPTATWCASRPGSSACGEPGRSAGRAESPFGDIWAYRQAIERSSPRRGRNDWWRSLARLRPGDIIRADKGRYRGPVAVVAGAHRKGGMRLTPSPRGATAPPHRRRLRRRPAARRHDRPAGGYAPKRPSSGARSPIARPGQARAARRGRAERRNATGSHPVETDPELRPRLRAAAQAERVGARSTSCASASRAATVAGPRVRPCARVLTGGATSRTATCGRRGRLVAHRGGPVLARIFHESDLLVAECLRRGLLDGARRGGLASARVGVRVRAPQPGRPRRRGFRRRR